MSDEAVKSEDRMWEAGFDGHEIAQRRRLARLTFRQKLEWLEEAHRTVLHLTGNAVETPPRGS